MSQSFIANTMILVFTLIFQRFCSTHSNPTGFSLKMIHRDSPESPLYPGNLTNIQKLERLVDFSQSRARYLEFSTSTYPNNYAKSNNGTKKSNDVIMSMFKDRFLYFVQLLLGNPPQTVYLVVDTGGSLVWTQCQPCVTCYQQTTPLFDARLSNTYRLVPCSHPWCTGPQAPFTCINNKCFYTATYGGGEGPTQGIASSDTIRFLLSTGGHGTINNIIFGCSIKTLKFPQFQDTVIGGIMGLSWAPNSLASQLAPYVNGRFSYCLVPFNADHPGPSTLSFGDAIPSPSGQLLTTTFVTPPPGLAATNYFYLNVLDISVGWDRLGFQPGTFGFWPDGKSGGFMIDSGAALSFITDRSPSGRNPYREVLTSFQRYYDNKGLRRIKNVPPLELCYEFPNGFKDFLTMTYHFEAANFIVDPMYVNFFPKGENWFCVGIQPGRSGLSILGAVHQQNTRFIFSHQNRLLQFFSQSCE